MSNPKIIGRKKEIQLLQNIVNSRKPEFVALHGRRRIGKTFLVKEFFKDQPVVFFSVTGQKNGKLGTQLHHFIQQVGSIFYGGASLQKVKNWDGAFETLTRAINQSASKNPIVLFFDELPWMATKKSQLLQSLDYYWNQFWSNNDRIKLFICGSSASWIIHKIIKNRGGLHNRVTERIQLEPFKLSETREYLLSLGVELNTQQILLLYMAMGGVPFYLSKVKKGLSAVQIIEDLAFSNKALLLEEFDNLFASLFDQAESYIRIVRIIAENRYGIGQQKLLESMGKEEIGGAGIKKLKDLEDAGFILQFKPLYHRKKGTYYRLIDEYTLFYLQWIEPIKDTLQNKAFDWGSWQATQQTPRWYSWQGYAFETVCYRHLAEIRKALLLTPSAIPSAWRYAPIKGSSENGAQIDLLFDRPDDSITLCEIKYTVSPFLIDKEYVAVLQKKIEVFKIKTKTKKQIFLSLISAQGLQNNYYAEHLIQNVVVLEDLFI